MRQEDARKPRSCRLTISAKSYLCLIRGLIEGLRAKIPEIAAAAADAAGKFVHGSGELFTFGAGGVVDELTGRSGGLMNVKKAACDNACDNPLLIFLRADDLAVVAALTAEWRRAGGHITVVGRRELLDRAVSAGCTFDRALENLSLPGGGAAVHFEGEKYRLDTDDVADVTLGWLWVGELAAACTRLGKMPVFYKSYACPDGRSRAEKMKGVKFHDFVPEANPPEKFARQFLTELSGDLALFARCEMAHVRAAARRALNARLRGARLWVFHHTHVMVRWEPATDDPPFFEKANDTWFGFKKDFVSKPGDFMLCALYGTFFADTSPDKKYWHGLNEKLRADGIELVWTLADYRRAQIADLPEHELFISQHWRYGDAVVDVPGYDVKILPTSGIIALTVFRMIYAEMIALSARGNRHRRRKQV